MLAVLCAIAVASRAAFKMIDHFKPMTAIIMISGMAFGPEAGFWWARSAASAATSSLAMAHGRLGRCLPSARRAFWPGAVPFGLVKQETASLVPFWLFCSPSPGGAAIGYLRAVYPDGGDQLGDGQGHLSVWVPINCIHGVATFLTLFFFSRPLFEKLIGTAKIWDDGGRLGFEQLSGGESGFILPQ